MRARRIAASRRCAISSSVNSGGSRSMAVGPLRAAGPARDPVRIFIAAEKFRQLAELATGPHLAIPRAVNDALCVELYFKSLLTASKTSYGGSYDLRSLFDKLPKAQKTMIIDIFNSQELPRATHAINAMAAQFTIPTSYKVDFDFVLDKSKDAFKMLRYAYEGRVGSWYGIHILYPTRYVILSLYPSWESQNPYSF